MHILMSIIVLIFIVVGGDWREWKRYLGAMQYIAIGNLTYNFLCASYFLWRLNADFISNHTLTEMLYTFIIFPGTALLFLNRFPRNNKDQIAYILLWVGIYVGVEWIYLQTNHILYGYGWSLKWSFLFDCLMFPMLLLYYKKPILAYILSVPIAIFWIWLFDVPVHLPVEMR
jgi:hypothetical protein